MVHLSFILIINGGYDFPVFIKLFVPRFRLGLLIHINYFASLEENHVSDFNNNDKLFISSNTVKVHVPNKYKTHYV